MRLTPKVDACTNFKLRSVALTSSKVEANPALWREVDNGNFQIVYASPEMLMDPTKHFQCNTVKEHNKFKTNLVLIAIDECHCLWCWERFRPEYRRLGDLRKIFIDIPFLCLSATIAPHVASYIHEVLSLRWLTVLFSLSIRRDDINIVVVPFGGPHDITPLRRLVTESIHDQRWDRAGRVGFGGMTRPARWRDLDFLDRPARPPSRFRPSDRLGPMF